MTKMDSHPTHTGKGLMAFWADIDPCYLLRFQEWHNCEHIPERVAIEGFERGYRLRRFDGEPSFLMMYRTSGSGVLQSPAYLDALNHPTPWTKEALTKFRNPVRNVYRSWGQCGDSAALSATPYVSTLRFNVAADTSVLRQPSAVLDYLGKASGAWLLEIFQVDRDGTGIATNERQIYGGTPGQQEFAVLLSSKARHEAEQVAEAARIVLEDHGASDLNVASYWLEFTSAPKELRP